MQFVLAIGIASMAIPAASDVGLSEGLPKWVKGSSGRTYEIVGRVMEVHPDRSPVFYVVRFHVDNLDNVPALRWKAEDLRPWFQEEAERAHFEWLALLAVKTDVGFGGFTYERRYGFTFHRDTAGIWRDATNLERPEPK